jgi:anti-sigma-K factor RskA
MLSDTRRRSWRRVIAISLAAFAAWVALCVLTYQDGPDDKPLIVSLLSK